jgi:Icc-related predicted phosphoesterase
MSVSFKNGLRLVLIAAALVVLSGSNKHQQSALKQNHVSLAVKVPPVFRFVALGDTRFHNPLDRGVSNAAVRHALVAAIDREDPAFISIGGDLVYKGEDSRDWEIWDSETSIWREHKIPVYPALGNHELRGNLPRALRNYFSRFPELKESRYYSMRAGNTLMLVVDSSLDEISGQQGDWLRSQLDHLPSDVDFVFFVFHHPPYTSSSTGRIFEGGGHSARSTEQAFAKIIEERQQHIRARFVFFNGHVHNYERHQHGGITYFVTGGGGAHPYIVSRHADDLYKDPGVNYHYLLVDVERNQLKVTMHKVTVNRGKEAWTQPDFVSITAPLARPAAQ